MSSISDKHPLYAAALADWTLMRDAWLGDTTVKGKGTTYLPSTEGMREKGMNNGQEGKLLYDAYVKRALFPELVHRGVQT
ncbi:MAG: hypothetical protein OES69_18350 [Myxococcales bacterium]|nr:hypothetical protein [Myxococcales bacterium]